MFEFCITTEVTEDRRVVIDLPVSTPLGVADIVVTVRPSGDKREGGRRKSLADWAEKYAEDFGDAVRSDDVEGFTGRRY